MPPSNATPVRQIEWLEVCPWLLLGRSFGVALEFRKLVLGTAGVLTLFAGWWLIAAVCQWSAGPFLPPATQAQASQALLGPAHWNWNQVPNPVLHVWWQLSEPLSQLVKLGLTWSALFQIVLSTVWALAVWGFFGGMLTRMAAIQLGLEEPCALGQAARFARTKWFEYATAPSLPLWGVLLLCLPLALAGLLMRVEALQVVVAVLWPIALVCGLGAAILLLGLIAAWPLMWASISVEGTDSFDAFSRSFGYISQRPFRFLLYAGGVMLQGIIGWLALYAIALLALQVTLWGLSWGLGSANTEQFINLASPALPVAAGTTAAGTSVIGSALQFWMAGVFVVLQGFAYSYFWTAAVAVYLVLRHDVDATDLDTIRPDKPRAVRVLAPLKRAADGLPIVELTPAGPGAQPVQPPMA